MQPTVIEADITFDLGITINTETLGLWCQAPDPPAASLLFRAHMHLACTLSSSLETFLWVPAPSEVRYLATDGCVFLAVAPHA